MFKEDLFELYIKKQTLMRTSNHAFLISVYYVGLQLFLIFFLVSFCCRLFLRFAFRIDNTLHCFTDRKLVQYAGYNTVTDRIRQYVYGNRNGSSRIAGLISGQPVSDPFDDGYGHYWNKCAEQDNFQKPQIRLTRSPKPHIIRVTRNATGWASTAS